jgi:hypothetical protein
MARRPLAFGARLRFNDRTVSIRQNTRNKRAYVVEDASAGRPTRRRDHPSLGGALRDLASTWRGRLH